MPLSRVGAVVCLTSALMNIACRPGPPPPGVTPLGDIAPPSAFGYVRAVTPFPVLDSTGRQLAHPFLGGLNAPRPQLVDIDGDGDLDLFLQEVTGRLWYFERDGIEQATGLPRFRFRSARYASLNVGEWYRFSDLDGDGDMDLLSESPFSYIRYYRNDGTRQDARFVVVADTLKDDRGVPIFADRQNIPQLGDINCNGLPDLLIGKVDGTATHYEMTPIGPNTPPRFRLVTERFENIQIQGQFGGSLHGANTMALADFDEDGDLDLFWGDFFEQGLLLLENVGTCKDPSLRSVPVQFPRAAPLLTSGYNAPTFGDVDGDGRLDLVVGVLGGAFNPNRTAIENLVLYTRGPAGAWLRRTDQLLPTVDVGNESIPSLVDLDNDGDLDLVLANKLDVANLTVSRMYWFENTGTRARPALRMRGVFPAGNGFHQAPAFGDLDGDGRPDMVTGGWGPRLAWYRHSGRDAAGVPRFELVDSAFVTITRGSNTFPTLGDLDGDGDLDLIVGEASGALNYYRNDGTTSIPNFVLVSDTWHDIDVGRRSAPMLVDFDGDGGLDMLIGSEIDGVHLYLNVGTRTEARFVRSIEFALDVPALAAPAGGDLDGNGSVDLVFGGAGGGIIFFQK